MSDIGKKIRELREAQGLTQEELAHMVGYKSRVSINKIELQRDIPIKKVVPIANALGVEVSELIGWDDGTISKELKNVANMKVLIDMIQKLDEEQLADATKYVSMLLQLRSK